ncbi:MAG: hypothetical protein ACRELS_07625 [Candidatus Rokuibacteriota bacterium]
MAQVGTALGVTIPSKIQMVAGLAALGLAACANSPVWSFKQRDAIGKSWDCIQLVPEMLWNADKDGTIRYRIDDPSREAVFVQCMREKHPDVPVRPLDKQ